MKKIYAVIKPAYVGDSENPLVCIDLAVILWHRASYESICGYSLGHAAQFFSDLDGALHSNSRRGYDAIIELDIDEQGQINAIYQVTCSKIQKKFVQDEGSRFFSKVKVPQWDKREIHENEMTSGAMAELQKQYNSSDLAKDAPLASAPPLNDLGSEIYEPYSKPVMQYTP